MSNIQYELHKLSISCQKEANKYTSARSPLSERLEQATRLLKRIMENFSYYCIIPISLVSDCFYCTQNYMNSTNFVENLLFVYVVHSVTAGNKLLVQELHLSGQEFKLIP